MANPIPTDLHRNGTNGRLARLAALAANRESHLDDEVVDEEPLPVNHGLHDQAPSEEGDELCQLRAENAELRRKLDEVQPLAGEARQLEETWAERQKEYEGLLDEKSEVIRELHRRVQELEAAVKERRHAATPREEELLSLHEELEAERKQIQEDEQTLMKQMREMELQMSRERAELARQRSELQRLHTEIHHELELHDRDATLRERLAPLQRRAQDVMTRRGAAPSPQSSQHFAARPQAQPQDEQPAPETKRSGVFSRIFGVKPK